MERAGRVVKRLLADDMWSGWGIRTLSADHPAYNPFSYQRGSVWPHDNATIAGGFRRYGYAAEAAQVAKALFDAAEQFAGTRLPELFSGMPRVPASFPAPYLGANVPQAWAAGAIFRLVAVLCGIHATFEQRRTEALRQPGAARLVAGGDDPQPARRERVARDPLPRRRRRRPVQHVGLHGHALSGSWPPRQPRCRLGGGRRSSRSRGRPRRPAEPG